MRTTLALDDELLDWAQALTGLMEKTALVREALKALIERESARRLARHSAKPESAAPAAVRTGVILDDTSVWGDHLRRGDDELALLLDRGQVAIHPSVTGELALGYLEPRESILRALEDLPQTSIATEQEVLQLIDSYALFGTGIGYVDAHLWRRRG